MFVKCIPIGVYTSNNQQVCEYLVDHSDSRIVIAENDECIKKYLNALENKKIDYIIVYGDIKESYPAFG